MTLNNDRDAHQRKAVKAIRKDLIEHGKACLNACPGYGKTRVVTDLIYAKAKEKKPDIKLVTLVGSDYLRDQWNQRDQYSEILTWQSVYNKPVGSISCDILVIDEIHKILLAPKYIKCLQVIKHSYLIGLSGTLDNRHLAKMRELGIPVSFVVTEKEAIEKGWLNQKKEFNLQVELSYADSMRYRQLEENYRSNALYIDPNVDDPENSTSWANFGVIAEVNRWVEQGYIGKEGEIYYDYDRYSDKIKHYKTGKQKGLPYVNRRYPAAERVARIRGCDPGLIIAKATEALKAFKQRANLTYNNAAKIRIIKEIIDRYPDRKFITFSNQTDFADLLEQKIGGKAYHGKQGKKVQKRIMSDFIEGSNNVLHTVSKIKEGADIPGVDTVINCSFYSKWTEKTQKDARAGRAEKDKKKTWVINLYCAQHRAFGNQSTFELGYLKNAQKRKINVEWIKTIDELGND